MLVTLSGGADAARGIPAPYSYDVHINRREFYLIHEVIHKAEYRIPTDAIDAGGPVLVIDIGANIGLFTLFVKMRFPQAVVHCFEPYPPTFALLQKNVGHLPGVHLHNEALSNVDTTLKMRVHPDNSGQNSLKVGWPSESESEVVVRKASDVYRELGEPAIDILKLDTEGSEVEILSSLRKNLIHVGHILLEYHTDGDRRKIDKMLSDFYLFEIITEHGISGVAKYVNKVLMDPLVDPFFLDPYRASPR